MKRLILLIIFSTAALCGMAQGKDKVLEEPKETVKKPFPLKKYYVEKAPSDKIRQILSHFHFSLATGYGMTAFEHTLAGYGINRGGGNPTISDGSNNYTNWISDVALGKVGVPKTPFGGDKLGFHSKTGAIPLGLALHFKFKYFRIGGGYTYELLSIGDFEPLANTEGIQPYKLNNTTALLRKYYGQISAPFYSNDRLILLADLQVGNFKFKTNFNADLIQPEWFYNAGVRVEYGLSEYLQVYLRPAYEIKNYTIEVGQGSIKHTMNTAYFTMGFTYSLPELPRCFNERCRTQVTHSHGNKTYRSRVHSIFQKQNPGTGENYSN